MIFFFIDVVVVVSLGLYVAELLRRVLDYQPTAASAADKIYGVTVCCYCNRVACAIKY